MLNTMKTYAAQTSKLSFIISYSEQGEGVPPSGFPATFSLLSGADGITVDLSADDLKALNEAVTSAYYATVS